MCILRTGRDEKNGPVGVMIRERGKWDGLAGTWIGQARWVATRAGWEKVRRRLAEKAEFRCEHCGCLLYYRGDAHHRWGRSVAKRDDRIQLPDGTRNLMYLCRECHSEQVIERK